MTEHIPDAAVEAMIAAASSGLHDDGTIEGYYAGLVAAALPHLVSEEALERAAGEDHRLACPSDKRELSTLPSFHRQYHIERVAAVLRAALGIRDEQEVEG